MVIVFQTIRVPDSSVSLLFARECENTWLTWLTHSEFLRRLRYDWIATAGVTRVVTCALGSELEARIIGLSGGHEHAAA